MREIWSEAHKLETWLQIEMLASEALCRQGLIPKRDFARMKARAAFSLERCKELGYGAVAVVGHPDYYPRFGFLPAKGFGIGCEYDVPEETFMILELHPGFLHGASGIIQYNEAFRNA